MRRTHWLAGAGVLILAGAVAVAILRPARLIDVYPREGMVKPGQPAHLEVVVKRPWYDFRKVTLTLTAGLSLDPVATLTTRGGTVEWTPPAAGGYGVIARLGREQASTALDVADNWTERPRYGFMSDFSPKDKGQNDRFETMAKFHLNGLQFYDWMYRHSDYLPPSQEFQDPLGRLLSRDVITEKLELARKHGMASMAYTAVYGAPKDFYEKHKEWGLYDASGRVLSFGNEFLYIMNLEAGSPWANHMLSEYGKIVTQLPFDGIHLDQYGDPKFGFRYPGGFDSPNVDVATAMADLINATKAKVGDSKAVIFNDVGGWPLADTAGTLNDVIYVEVWPPNINFDHLHQLIEKGRKLSGGKPVVLAAYISPFFGTSVLLSDAVIFASGGYHLEIGEGGAMLSDPYFPKYKQMDPALAKHLRRYYDVAVRYHDLLYGKDLTDWAPEVNLGDIRVLKGGYYNGVWAKARENDKYGVMHLINLTELDDARWNSPRLDRRPPLGKLSASVVMAKAPKALYLIDPDELDQSPAPVTFTYQDGKVSFVLDRLDYWSMLVFEK